MALLSPITMRVGRGKSTPKPGKQRGKNGNHLPKQQEDDAARDEHHGDRVNQRRLHGALELDRFLNVAREALQNGVENAAGLACFHHVAV